MKIFIIFCLNFLLLHTLISQNTAEQEGFKNKLSNTTQKNTYEQFLKAINEQHWALPANASAVYYKNLLEDDKLEESLAKSFRKQWISAFQEKAQLLINQFINNSIIASHTDFEEGSVLMQECLGALSSGDKEFKSVKLKRLFLDAFATYRKDQEGKLKGTITEKHALFSALIPNLEDASKLTSESYIQRAIGLFYQEVGDETKAELAFQKAIALSNNDAVNSLALGDFYLAKEHFEKAMTAYKKANKLKTGQLTILERISNTAVLQGKPDTALKIMNNFLLDMPIIQNKQYQQAAQFFKNQQKTESDGFYYYAMGVLAENGLGTAKNIEEAQKWYEYAQALNLLVAGEKLSFFYTTGLLFAKDKAAELNRIKQNSLQRARLMKIPCLNANGLEQITDIYIQDFPKDPANPMAQENKRLQEVLGLTIQPAILDAFNQLYQFARKSNRSYQEVCIAGLDIPNPKSAQKLPDNTIAVTTVNTTEKSVQNPTNNFEAQALQAIDNKQFDKVDGLMANAVTQTFNLTTQDLAGTEKKLITNLTSATNQEPLTYYALGYLYETTDRGKSLKWYNYAFQMGYKPAYYKLSNLYKTVSDSKIRWLRDNFNKGFTKLSMPCKRPDGSNSSTIVYLMEYPWDINSPLEPEANRLKDGLQSTIDPAILAGFGQVYQLALANNVSFTALVNTAISLIQQKKVAQKDIDFKAVKALESYMK